MTLKDKYIFTEPAEVERIKKFKFIYAIIIMILYSIIINVLGFYISTVMLFIATVFILSEESFQRPIKSYVTIFVTALIIVGVVYFLFNTLLGVPLPTLI